MNDEEQIPVLVPIKSRVFKKKISRPSLLYWAAVLFFLTSIAPLTSSACHAAKNSMIPENGLGGWLGPNGKIPPPDLSGKVVLFDFWDYTCINCIRTFPHLNLLYEKYKDKGLIIVGIHSPEFSFAAQPSRVQHAIEQYALSFPVVMDRNQILWDKFNNHFWPADYLYDKDGHLVYHSFGEGGYGRLEQKIRETLHLEKSRTPQEHALDFPEGLTPELYAGYERGHLGNRSGYHPGTTVLYSIGHLKEDHITLEGKWRSYSDHLASGETLSSRPPGMTVLYHGAGVNAVLKRSSSKKGQASDTVVILIDGHPVASKLAGKDIRFRSAGNKRQSIVSVQRARMYSLVSGQPFGLHRIDLLFLHKGTDVYTLTFNP
jgi:thiol-disulfide isomerase/thioredoxin